jgi:hypothetical protein
MGFLCLRKKGQKCHRRDINNIVQGKIIDISRCLDLDHFECFKKYVGKYGCIYSINAEVKHWKYMIKINLKKLSQTFFKYVLLNNRLRSFKIIVKYLKKCKLLRDMRYKLKHYVSNYESVEIYSCNFRYLNMMYDCNWYFEI